ncbi:MAG: hypothetical protein FWC47_11170 [Oscillospiraceae bacterium]|nr:hypothetical protein [Oscillospiraceae bacterium]
MKNKKHKKSLLMIITIAIIVSIIIVPTKTAGQQIDNEQHKSNTFTSDDQNIKVTLENIFTPPVNWRPGQTINNQMSVTNLDESIDFAFVRLQFKEYLEFSESALVTDALLNPILFKTWDYGPKIGKYMLWNEKPANLNLSRYTVNGVDYCRTQNIELKDGIYGKPMHGSTSVSVFGTAAKANYPMQPHTIQSPIHPECLYNVTGWDDATGTPIRSGNIRTQNNTGPDAISDYISWAMGTNVITMHDWAIGGAVVGGVTLGPRQLGNFWIVDADGWIYWANGIRPNSTTSNVLESVTLNSMLTNATGLEYCIHVDMEVCTQGELNTAATEWGNNASVNGQDLIGELQTLVVINETNFPDPVFRQWVADNLDPNGDGVLTVSERNAVTVLNTRNTALFDVSDYTGIAYFTNLTSITTSTSFNGIDFSVFPHLATVNTITVEGGTLDLRGAASLQTLFVSKTTTVSMPLQPISIVNMATKIFADGRNLVRLTSSNGSITKDSFDIYSNTAGTVDIAIENDLSGIVQNNLITAETVPNAHLYKGIIVTGGTVETNGDITIPIGGRVYTSDGYYILSTGGTLRHLDAEILANAGSVTWTPVITEHLKTLAQCSGTPVTWTATQNEVLANHSY